MSPPRALFDLECIDVRTACAACGRHRVFPEGRATRVLEGDALFADVEDPCEQCGARRVRIEVEIDDGDEEEPKVDEGRSTPRVRR